MLKKTICTLIMLLTVVALVDEAGAGRRRGRSSSRSRQMRKIQKAFKAEQKRYQKQYKKDMKEYQKYQKIVGEQQRKAAIIAHKREKRAKANRLKKQEERREKRREYRLKNESTLGKTNSRKPSVARHVSLPKIKLLMKKLDKDKNGSLTKQEVKGSLFEKQFQVLDKNKDGKIVLKEAYHLKTVVNTKKEKKQVKSTSSLFNAQKKKKISKK